MLPLCVDLDGTLIKTDVLWESILLLARKNFLLLFLIPIWLLRGRPYLKYQLAKAVTVPVEHLPYHQEFLAWLKELHQQGRELVLVTASNELQAQLVANYLGIFSRVYASNLSVNLKSTRKRDLLNKVFGEKQYDYAGNESADYAVWKSSYQAVVVNAPASVEQHCAALVDIAKVFKKPKLTLNVFLKAIRLHQYVKNLLIFVPLLLGHFIANVDLWLQCIQGFICFSLLASSIYILNDLLDLNSDRQHPIKCQRAFAMGLISIPTGLRLMLMLLGLAMALAVNLPQDFQIILALYYGIALGYSLFLKQQILIDVLTLAALYTFRILAGAAIIDVGYSDWLVLFSLFFFTSLAFVKRYTELSKYANHCQAKLPGRAYDLIHMTMINTFGISSGYLSALIFALYLNSEKASTLYQHPRVLYLICPLILYWLSRMWFKAAENVIDDDPVMFALRDKTSYWILAIMAILMIVATI